MAGERTLRVKIVGDAQGAVDALGSVAAKAAGIVAAVAGVGVALNEAFDVEKATDKLSAQLGLVGEESKKAGDIAGSLYSNAYGESMEDVSQAVGQVMSSIEGMRDAASPAIEAVTTKALDFAEAFEVDVATSANTVGLLLQNGLVKDASEGFDLMTKSFQQVPAAMRDELPEILHEYATNFRALGFTGPQTFELLTNAAKKGKFALDKVGDGLKELTIRGTDMSATSMQAYDNIGLRAGVMAKRLAAGGEEAQGAVQLIATELLKVEDPVNRANNAIALFGTPLEDLSVDEIPQFLESIANVGDGMTDAAGAAAEMGKILNDNAATNLTSFYRKAKMGAVTILGGTVVPAINDVVKVGQALLPTMDELRSRSDMLNAKLEMTGTAFQNLAKGDSGLFAEQLDNVLGNTGKLIPALDTLGKDGLLAFDAVKTSATTFATSVEGSVSRVVEAAKDTGTKLVEAFDFEQIRVYALDTFEQIQIGTARVLGFVSSMANEVSTITIDGAKRIAKALEFDYLQREFERTTKAIASSSVFGEVADDLEAIGKMGVSSLRYVGVVAASLASVLVSGVETGTALLRGLLSSGVIEQISGALVPMGRTIMVILEEVTDGFDFLTKGIRIFDQYLVREMGSAWQTAGGIVSDGIDVIKTVLGTLLGVITTLTNEMSIVHFAELLAPAWALVGDAMTVAADAAGRIAPLLGEVGSVLQSSAGWVTSSALPMVRDLLWAIASVVGGPVFGVLSAGFKAAADVVSGFVGILTDLGAKAAPIIEDVFGWVGDEIRDLGPTIDTVADAFGRFGAWAKDSGFPALKDALSGVLDVLGGPVLSTAKTVLGGLLDVGKALVPVVLWLASAVGPVLTGALHAVGDVLSWVADLWENHKTALTIVAGLLIGVVGPALLVAAAAATVSAVETGILLTLYKVDAIKAAASSVLASGRIAAGWLLAGAAAVKSAAETAILWLMYKSKAVEAAVAFLTQVKRIVLGYVAMGVAAVKSAAETAILWTMYKVESIKAAVAHAGGVSKIVLGWMAAGAAAVKSGAQTVAIWAMYKAEAVKGAAVQLASMARIVAGWVVLGAQSLLQAARVAAAWLIAMGPIGLIIAAVAALVVVIVKNWDTIAAFIAGAWDRIKEGAAIFWEWLKSAASQVLDFIIYLVTNWTLAGLIFTHLEEIKGFFARAWDWVSGKVRDALAWIGGIVSGWDLGGKVQAVLGAVGGFFTGAWEAIKRTAWDALVAISVWAYEKLNSIVDVVKGLGGSIAGAAGSVWDGLKNSFTGAINWILRKWNGLEFRIPSIEVFGQKVGGVTIGVPDIPLLAEGGTVLRSGAAIVGEAGPELVDLKPGARVTPLTDGQKVTGGPTQITVNVKSQADPWQIGREVAWSLRTRGV